MPPRRKAGKRTRQSQRKNQVDEDKHQDDGDREMSPHETEGSSTQDKDQSQGLGPEKSTLHIQEEHDVADEKELAEAKDQADGDDVFDIVIPPPCILHTRVKTPKKVTVTPMKVTATPKKVTATPKKVTATPKKKRRPNNLPFPFLPEQEKVLAEWYIDNPCFYNKRSKLYRYTQVKKRMLEEKAKEYKDPEGGECTADQLSTWMTSMRTYYGKLSKQPKSGSGAEGGHKPTERELWIQTSFTFLSDHIVRIPGRQGFKLTSQVTEETGHVDENDDGLDVLSSQDPHDYTTLDDLDSSFETEPSTSTRKGKGKGKSSRKEKKTPEESDIETIEKICSTILKTAAHTPSPTSPRSAELDNFAKDVASSMRRVPEERWNAVKMDIMMVIRNFSGAVSSQSTGMGYSAPAVEPTFNSNNNFNVPSRFNRTQSLYRAPPPIATSSSQYVQQTQQRQPPQQQAMPSPGPGVQYMPLVTTSSHIPGNASNTSATSTDEGEMFNFNNV